MTPKSDWTPLCGPNPNINNIIQNDLAYFDTKFKIDKVNSNLTKEKKDFNQYKMLKIIQGHSQKTSVNQQNGLR